jgi:hypothetical protein
MSMLLYKYCPPQGVAILRECSIWLTDPRIFGDAYEPAPRSSTAASELVLSLSASWNSLPMWRDYAAAHTGLVIGFDFLQGILTADPAYDYRIAPVVYASDRSGGDTLLAKSQEWEHEDEWRLVAARRTPDDSGHRAPHRPFAIRPESVQAVILGCRADLSAREFVAGALAQAPFQHVRFLQAVPDERGYHLNLIEFSREA